MMVRGTLGFVWPAKPGSLPDENPLMSLFSPDYR